MLTSALCMSMVLYGCGSQSTEDQFDAEADEAADATAEAAYSAVEVAEPADVAADEVESMGFTGCTSDCSGHEAGFNWARDRDLTDEWECGGNSSSFIDGCRQFVEARQTLAEGYTEEDADEFAEERAEE